jgi:hypothetical protein
VNVDLSSKAPLASPTFTGTPAAPTASAGTNTTQLATTAFVTDAVGTAQQGVKGVNDQTGTTYTLVLADAGKWVRCSNASAIALTVPPNSSVAFPVGTVVTISQAGAGAVTITAGSGVTINKRSALTLVTNGQYAVAGIMKSATDTWTAFGDLA